MANRSESQLERAVRWAFKQHRHQLRDGEAALPYVSHPIDVLNRLRYVGGVTDEQVLVGAALHDVVEECGVSLSKIGDRFGERVQSLVTELTRKEPTAEEIEGLSEGAVADLRSKLLLGEIAAMSPEAMTVKLADRLSNLEAAMATRTGEKRARYVVQSRQILAIIPKSVNPGLWKELERMVKSAEKSLQG